MELNLIIKLAITGISAGILSGLFGVGGGIILVPMLIWVMGMSQAEAQGTSIAAIMLLPMGILAVWQYHKQGHVDFKTAAVIAAFFLIGSYAGARIAVQMHMDILRKLFAFLMILVGFRFILLK